MHVSAVAADNNVKQHVGEARNLSATAFRRVLACIDESEFSNKLIPHAVAVAEALHAPLTLLRVLEVAHHEGVPPDPIAWSIHRREAQDDIDRMARDQDRMCGSIDTIVVEGEPAEQICRWARANEMPLTVIGTSGGGGATEWELGDTARKLIDRATGAVLLVPSSVSHTRTVHYRRLLVPLDGSCQAESVLPLAISVAEAEEAELLLAHVVPTPELTEIGPLEADDHKLREQVASRNERVARHYLDRVRAGIAERGIAVRSIVLREGDARSRLARFIVDKVVDLVVLSSHGRTGRADVSCGSVAAYLLTHASAPVLMVLRGAERSIHSRPHMDHRGGRVSSRASL